MPTMEYVVDQTAQFLLYEEPEQPTRKKSKQKRQPRKRSTDDYVVTVVLTAVFFIISRVPLWGGTSGLFESDMTFRRANTLMSIGTHPFVTSSMICGLWDKKMPNFRRLVCGFGLGVVQSIYYSSGVLSAIQLIAMCWILMNAIDYSERHGAISLTTTLIVANASLRILRSDVLSLAVTMACIVALCYIDDIHVSVALTHTKSRQMTSGKLRLLYNGTTPLIIYYTLIEWSPWSVPFILMVPCVYWLCKVWPTVNETTGFHLIKQYGEDNLTLKGWRSTSAMGFHLDRQVKKLCLNNAIILIVMAAVSTFVQPSVSCGTLLILLQAIKQEQPHDQLRQKLYPLLRLLRL